jgi:hypothetical protein
MRLLLLLVLCLPGCVSSDKDPETVLFDHKKDQLEREITILKLQVRKERLENQLEDLEVN